MKFFRKEEAKGVWPIGLMRCHSCHRSIGLEITKQTNWYGRCDHCKVVAVNWSYLASQCGSLFVCELHEFISHYGDDYYQMSSRCSFCENHLVYIPFMINRESRDFQFCRHCWHLYMSESAFLEFLKIHGSSPPALDQATQAQLIQGLKLCLTIVLLPFLILIKVLDQLVVRSRESQQKVRPIKTQSQTTFPQVPQMKGKKEIKKVA
jgi:hypothetical protein